MANLNITNIPAPRVSFLDARTGLMSREWYRFFLNLFILTGSGSNPTTLDELQLGPPNQPELAELLLQINQNVAPQYEDQSGDFLATLDTAQLMSMMARFENAEAAIQGAYLQPVVQTGTIASYNLDGSPTLGGVAYGTGPALAVSAAGSAGQVLTSAGAATPTWATPTTGTVSSVSVVSANGLAGTVATATTTPAITLSTTITGLLKGNGTAISAAASGTDYAPATSGTSILYGNGAGGFSNVTIGTGVSFAAGTLSATGSGGTVTSVTGTAPVVSSGGATPAISMPAATTSVNGYLTSTDWTAFNNKVTMTYPGSGIPNSTGSAWGTSYSTTGSGTVVALATSPSFTTPTLGAALATSIKFGSGAVLSSYEQGSWTPTLIGSTTNPSVTYGLQRAIYTRVGRVVTVSCFLSWSAFSGGSGNVGFGNLPFTIESSVGSSFAGSIALFDGFTLSAARTSVGLLGSAGTTYSLPTCFGSAVSSQYIGVGSVAASGLVVYTLTYSV